MFARQAVTIPVILGYLWATGGLGRLRTRRIGTHARRSVMGMSNMICSFGAAMLLPLAISTTLSFTAPIFAVLISYLWFREKVGPWRWSAVALGFAGVLLIARPGSEPLPLLGAAIGLLSPLLVAMINHQVRDLGRTEEAISSTFWFAAFGAPMVAVILPFFASHHSWWQYLILLGIGLAGTAAQFLISASLRMGAVASVIVMDYTSLIWSTFYGWSVWNSLPPASTWIGAPLIIAAGVLIAWREHRLAHAPPPASSISED